MRGSSVCSRPSEASERAGVRDRDADEEDEVGDVVVVSGELEREVLPGEVEDVREVWEDKNCLLDFPPEMLVTAAKLDPVPAICLPCTLFSWSLPGFICTSWVLAFPAVPASFLDVSAIFSRPKYMDERINENSLRYSVLCSGRIQP